MLKKEITFTNQITGTQETEEHYFNLTKAEIIEIDASYPGGVIEYLTRAVKLKDTKTVIGVFKDLILKSYGEKTASGRFIKSQELRDSFMTTEAYSELFMELLENEENAGNFVNGIIPQVPAAKNVSNVVPLG